MQLHIIINILLFSPMDDVSPMQPVWQLYDLQNECIKALARRSWTRKFKGHMRGKVQLMSRLLGRVRGQSSGYTGGDDVLQAIEDIQGDVKRRIGDL